MKKALQIFKRDINRLIHNKAALLIVVGVSILPSLYAWFNIAANMDPYGNTGQVKVAVANCDKEAKSSALTLNAGKTIIDNLKENDQLGWTFVSEEKAIEGVRSGKYYAAIVIPEDFSSSLISILSGEVKTPELDYYVNEKKNAIAPKITDSGASTIQQQINDTFSSVAAETISDIVKESAGELTDDVSRLNSSIDSDLSKVRKNLAQYQKVLKNFKETSDGSSDLISDTVDILDSLDAAVEDGEDALSDTDSVMKANRKYAGALSGAFLEAFSDGETVFNDIYSSVSDSMSEFEAKADKASTAIDGSISTGESLTKKNDEVLDSLTALNNAVTDDEQLSASVSEKIKTLQSQNASLKELLASLKSGKSGIDSALQTGKATTKDLKALTKSNKTGLRKYVKNFNNTLMPELNSSLDSLSSLGGSLSSTLSGLPATTSQMKLILNQLDDSLSDSADALGDTGEMLTSVDTKLSDVSSDLKALQSSEAYDQLLSLRGLDAESISDFMSSPVNIESKTVYSVKNYGSAMTPFYTNLALWVGGLVLVSIFKQEVDKDEKVKHFGTKAAYFGRWLLFVSIGVIQGCIVCAGDILLLKVQCLHPVLFVLAGMFCSFVYVNLIYALALGFKHIGKALGVILIIIQIPGSSGTYPIEMTPAFFQKVHPLLPFTYGINAMRECIAGMYGMNYIKNLLILAVFIPIGFFIGLVIRPLLMNVNHLFDKRLAETDLMLCETESRGSRRTNLTLMVKIFMKDDDLKKEFLDKAARFEKNYPKMIRYGFLSMLIIPLVFLILMFSLESKIVFLTLWIISLILLALYLFFVEYFHDRLQKELSYIGLSSDDLIKAIKEEQDE